MGDVAQLHEGTMRKRSVVALAYDGLCAFEFGVTAELFGLARPELAVDWYDFSVVSTDPGPLRTLGGLTLQAPTDLSLLVDAGTVVIPGWRDVGEVPPPQLLEALCVAHENGARLLSICSGVFVLAATGLLDDARATTHWRYVEQLRSAYPRIDVEPDVLYVDNGSLLTSAGSAAGIDLCLHLVRRDHGADVASDVARRLVMAPHRSGGQAQFIPPATAPHRDRSVGDTMVWALERLDEPLTVALLAGHAHMSQRTFARRFVEVVGQPPHSWLSRQRVLRAQELLETTDLAVEDIAGRCGFGSAANLRTHFGRQVHTSPIRYRSSFRRGPGG